MVTVYLLTLRQLSGRWRLLIMAVLATMPMLITALMLQSSGAPSVEDFEEFVFSAMLAGSITPLAVLAISAAAFANEIEDSTLANLALAAIPRWQIVVPKLLAAITIAAPFIVISAYATGHMAYLGDVRATVAATVAALIAVVLYSSAFVWLGLVSTQAIGVGLLYIVLWEGLFSRFVAGVRLLSIRHYAISWMHALDGRRFAGVQDLSSGVAILVSILVLGGFVLLAVRRLRRMDVP